MKRKVVQIGIIAALVLLGFVTWLIWPYIPNSGAASKALETASAASANPAPRTGTDTVALAHGPSPSNGSPPGHEIAGIGAALKWDSEHAAPQIAQVLPNSPASNAGLAQGLIIRRIDSTATEGMGLSACVQLIGGPVGSHVILELLDPALNATNVVEITRQRVAI